MVVVISLHHPIHTPNRPSQRTVGNFSTVEFLVPEVPLSRKIETLMRLIIALRIFLAGRFELGTRPMLLLRPAMSNSVTARQTGFCVDATHTSTDYHPSLTHSHAHRRIVRQNGLTLIEVMIATTLTLLMMLALAQGFKTLSDGITAGRSKLTLSDQLRGISTLFRSDLDGLTVDNEVPQKTGSASGYFMYYDGPIADASAMLYNYLPAATTIERKLASSRHGDIDDIVMFTAKARPGEWFRGKVPKALLLIHMHNEGLTGAPSLTPADWLEDVSIASEYGEVVWCMRPLNQIGTITNGELPPSSGTYPFAPPATASTPVIDNAPGTVDRDGNGVAEPDGMPDRIALCRRVLLVRPDLNITPPSSLSLGTTDPQLSMQPLPPTLTSVDSFRYMMRFAYQRGDLSVRPYHDGTRLTLKTNSLYDLQFPENRYAHFVYPTSGTFTSDGASVTIANVSSMPLLALTTEADSTGMYLPMTNQLFGSTDTSTGIAMAPIDRGFIPAAFFRTKVLGDSTGITTVIAALDEIIAGNVCAFDLRGYDISAQNIANRGIDGAWGTAGVDDDQNGTIDDVSESGWPATDDLVLGPSEPGYARLIKQSESGAPVDALVLANSGAFVDLGWGRKVINQPFDASTTGLSLNHFTATTNESLWYSAMSMLSPPNGSIPTFGQGASQPITIASLARSGRFAIESGTCTVYQPCFDTFTDGYESDGVQQYTARSDSGPELRTMWANGLSRYGLPLTDTGFADRGNDGLDNFLPSMTVGDGFVDDDLEKETSAPLVYRLPSIQATIRVQDISAGTLQQISVVHHLEGQ